MCPIHQAGRAIRAVSVLDHLDQKRRHRMASGQPVDLTGANLKSLPIFCQR
jgi:hypothetical protein